MDRDRGSAWIAQKSPLGGPGNRQPITVGTDGESVARCLKQSISVKLLDFWVSASLKRLRRCAGAGGHAQGGRFARKKELDYILLYSAITPLQDAISIYRCGGEETNTRHHASGLVRASGPVPSSSNVCETLLQTCHIPGCHTKSVAALVLRHFGQGSGMR